MSLDWQTFKSALGRNASVTYIDEEYSEIPIDSECEFQEALRLARLNKKSLRIIVYDHKSYPSQKRYLDLPATSFAIPEEEKFVFTKMNSTSDSPGMKETCCHCKEDIQPEWFTHYMKRFKKQLFHELKSYIHSAIYSIIEKEKKLTAKSDTHDVVCKKRESLFPGSTQKKEKLEKDSSDLIDQREVKLQRKLEKLLSSKSERLEKLDNKIFKSSNEVWLLKEAKLHSKRKFSRTRKGVSDKNEGCAPIPIPGRKIFELLGLPPEEKSTSRTRLSPLESSSAIMKEKVSKSEGAHRVRCRADDGEETFGSEFICGERMEPFTADDKFSGSSASSKESQGTAGEARNTVGALIDFEKDVIASSQKKIEENIIEIQKRLHDIDLLGPLSSAESNANEKRANGNGEKWKNGCDLLQDLEVKEKNLKQKLEQEKVLFGIDCLSLDQPLNETCNLKTSEEKGNKKPDNLEDTANKPESEHCTDSEMSVIFVSEEEDEEEENFVVIPSKSPSPANSVNDDKVSPERESKTRNEQPEVKKAKSTNEENVAKKETEEHREKIVEGIFCQPTSRSRRSPFGEETFKPKKIKSKSTEYHFSTENLTHPTFVQHPEGVFETKSSRFAFKFTAGEEENSQKHKPEKGEDCKEKKVPKAFDSLGRVIYAVNSNGHCVPMEYVLRQREQTTQPTRVLPGVPQGVSPGVGSRSADRVFSPHQQERRSDRSKEIPSVSFLPDALMNGASNVASMAFNTAKSVINNLQSAFVSEGKAEMRHPAYEANEFQGRHVSSEALIRLCDMGFLNIELNRQLLLLNGNDLIATVEELIRLHQS